MVNNSYFQAEGQFYMQTSGLPMGGVLSPLLSNIYMDFFEQLALTSFTTKPLCWFRYLEDVFCIWQNSTLPERFLNHLNSLRTTLKFTLEQEHKNQLPFLDVMVFKLDNNLETKVYKKPTSTGQYLNYYSNHAGNVKLALAHGLFKRALKYTSRESDRKKEIQAVFHELKNNGYPNKVLNKALKKAQGNSINNNKD